MRRLITLAVRFAVAWVVTVALIVHGQKILDDLYVSLGDIGDLDDEFYDDDED